MFDTLESRVLFATIWPSLHGFFAGTIKYAGTKQTLPVHLDADALDAPHASKVYLHLNRAASDFSSLSAIFGATVKKSGDITLTYYNPQPGNAPLKSYHAKLSKDGLTLKGDFTFLSGKKSVKAVFSMKAISDPRLA